MAQNQNLIHFPTKKCSIYRIYNNRDILCHSLYMKKSIRKGGELL